MATYGEKEPRKRKVAECAGCGNEREIFAHSQCHKCDMAYRRGKADSGRNRAETHAAAIIKRQEKFDAGLVAMKKLCNEFEQSGLMLAEDVEALRATILPYVNKIGASLEPPSVKKLEAALESLRAPVLDEESEAAHA